MAREGLKRERTERPGEGAAGECATAAEREGFAWLGFGGVVRCAMQRVTGYGGQCLSQCERACLNPSKGRVKEF